MTHTTTHLTRDRVEHQRVVVGPSIVAALLGDFLYKAYDGPPDSSELVLVVLLLLQVGEELGGVGQEFCTVILGVDRQTFAMKRSVKLEEFVNITWDILSSEGSTAAYPPSWPRSLLGRSLTGGQSICDSDSQR